MERRRTAGGIVSTIKNEHVVWGYADRQDGKGQVVLVGITDVGLRYLQDQPGQTLLVNPPGAGFTNVTQIVVFAAKDKAELKDLFRKAGRAVSEVN